MDGRQPPLPDFTLLPSALTLPTKVPTLRGWGRSGVVILLQIPINQLLADTFHDLANTSAGRGPRAAPSEQDPQPPHRSTKERLHPCCIPSCAYDLIRVSGQGSKPAGWQPGCETSWSPERQTGQEGYFLVAFWRLPAKGSVAGAIFFNSLVPEVGRYLSPTHCSPPRCSKCGSWRHIGSGIWRGRRSPMRQRWRRLFTSRPNVEARQRTAGITRVGTSGQGREGPYH